MDDEGEPSSLVDWDVIDDFDVTITRSHRRSNDHRERHCFKYRMTTPRPAIFERDTGSDFWLSLIQIFPFDDVSV